MVRMATPFCDKPQQVRDADLRVLQECVGPHRSLLFAADTPPAPLVGHLRFHWSVVARHTTNTSSNKPHGYGHVHMVESAYRPLN